MSGNSIVEETSQYLDNKSFDKDYQQNAVEILVENEAGTALVRQKPIATEAKQDEIIAGQYPTGTGSNGSVTLTNANTAYAIPGGTAPTGSYVMNGRNNSGYDIYIGYANSNSNGTKIPDGSPFEAKLGASEVLYAYSVFSLFCLYLSCIYNLRVTSYKLLITNNITAEVLRSFRIYSTKDLFSAYLSF